MMEFTLFEFRKKGFKFLIILIEFFKFGLSGSLEGLFTLYRDVFFSELYFIYLLEFISVH